MLIWGARGSAFDGAASVMTGVCDTSLMGSLCCSLYSSSSSFHRITSLRAKKNAWFENQAFFGSGDPSLFQKGVLQQIVQGVRQLLNLMMTVTSPLPSSPLLRERIPELLRRTTYTSMPCHRRRSIDFFRLTIDRSGLHR